MKRFFRALTCCILCAAIFVSMGLFAYADSTNLIRGNKSGSSDSSSSVGSLSNHSYKDRLDECNTVYNRYQDIKYMRRSFKMDSFVTAHTIDGNIKQIDILPACKVDKNTSSSNYIINDDLDVIYYYTDSGFPRFSLMTDKSTIYDDEYRLFLSEGEVIKYIDDNGDTYSSENSDLSELNYVYDYALAAYARAYYDHTGKGKYIVQMGCFKDLDDANECKQSMDALGEEVVIDKLDNVYCVVSKYYFNDWNDASKYGADMDFSDDCGTIFVRLLDK